MTRRLLSFLFFIGLSSVVVFGQAQAKWETFAAEARALVAESSWTLAVERFEAALAAAPEEADTRQLQLELVQAQLPALGQGRDWHERQSQSIRLTQALDELIPDYDREDESGALTDWELSVLNTQIAVSRAIRPRGIDEQITPIAVRLGRQPASPENTAKLARFLQNNLDENLFRGGNPLNDLEPLLRAVRDRAPEVDQRAWAALKLAQLAFYLPIAEDTIALWREAREVARGSAYEPHVAAGWFLWCVTHGWSDEGKLNTPRSVTSLLNEAEALIAKLVQSPYVEPHSDYVNQLSRYRAEWKQPQLALDVAQSYLPDAPIEFSFASAGIADIEFELLRLRLDPSIAIPRQNDPKVLRRVGTSVGQWTVAVESPSDLAWNSHIHTFDPQPAPGFYALFAKGTAAGGEPDLHQVATFTVSAVRVTWVVPTIPDTTTELIVTDARTGQPVADAQLRGFTRYDTDQTREWSLRTDANGRAVGLILPQRREYYRWAQLHLLGEADAQPFKIHSAIQPRDDLRADIVIDRPLYRPGETLHWKLIVRQREQSTWHVPDLPFDLQIQDASGADLLHLPGASLDRFGAIDGEIALPADVKLGPVSFTLRTQDRLVELQELCVIDNYVPPALSARITLDGATDGLRPGRLIPIRVAARYLSGGPALNAKVALQVTAPNLEGVNEDTTLEAHTDAAGDAVFHWQAPAYDETLATSLELRADVLPSGGQPIVATASWTLSAAGLSAVVDQTTAALLVKPGESVAFTGKITNGADVPAAFRGVAELVRVHWQGLYFNAEGHVVDHTALPEDQADGVLPPGWATIVEDYIETQVVAQDLAASADGTFEVAFVAPTEGLYRLRITDREENVLNPTPPAVQPWRSSFEPQIASHDFAMVVVDEHTQALPLPRHRQHVFVRNEAGAASPPQALVALGDANTSMLLTIVREGETFTRILPPGKALRWIDLDEQSGKPGAGELRLTHLDGQRGTHMPFHVEAPSPLQLRVDAPAVARPGETVRVTLRALDADNHPVDAQLLHVVADAAVINLLSDPDSQNDSTASPFDDTSDFLGARLATSAAPELRPRERIPDPRTGTVVRATAAGGVSDQDEYIVLNAFSVQTGSDGYLSSSTLAGSRMQRIDYEEAEGYAMQSAAFTQHLAPPGFPSPQSESDPAPIRLRRIFASTAAWLPTLNTDKHSAAKATYTLPDNLTSWRLLTYATSADGRSFDVTTSTLQATLPLQARLQVPRFLIAGDTASPSVVAVNRTPTELDATVSLRLAGDAAELSAEPPATQSLTLPANGEANAFWELHAHAPGSVQLTALARASAESDGMVLPLTVHEDGIKQHLAASTRLDAETRRAAMTLSLPDPLDRARTTVTVDLATSPAVAALDALPYLVNYPYGCVEQTMSRFLPAVIVREALTKLGLDPHAVETRILDGESATDARRRQDTAALSRLDDVMQQSLARLYDAQIYSGGWGWWPDASNDDPWMTAYVTWGLSLADDAGLDVSLSVLQNARQRCAQIAADPQVNIDHRAWALRACTTGDTATPENFDVIATVNELFAQRDDLTPSGRAVFAFTVARAGTAEQRDIIVRNLANQTKRETSDLGTLVHWGSVRGHWNALNGAHEATALSVLALLELDPTNDLIEPAIAWLSLNRRSAHWESTRATTFAVLALAQQLKTATAAAETEVDLRLNGRKFETVKLSPRNLLEQPLRVNVPLDRLRAGDNQIELRRRETSATSPLYATALASAWATGNAVKPAAHVINVERDFARLIATPTVLGPARFSTAVMGPNGSVAASDEVHASVQLNVPHELHYLMIKVPKPAGCEPLNPLSGWDVMLKRRDVDDETFNRERLLYREEHDDHTAIFIDRIQPGEWEITTRLRAVTPGDYRALPATAEAMYVPEITANSDARRVTVERRP